MLRRILPHISIVLCNMYLVFFAIDRVNSAMSFINNNLTKVLLLVLCIISTVNAAFLIHDQRKKVAAREAARRRAVRNRMQAANADSRHENNNRNGRV